MFNKYDEEERWGNKTGVFKARQRILGKDTESGRNKRWADGDGFKRKVKEIGLQYKKTGKKRRKAERRKRRKRVRDRHTVREVAVSVFFCVPLEFIPFCQRFIHTCSLTLSLLCSHFLILFTLFFLAPCLFTLALFFLHPSSLQHITLLSSFTLIQLLFVPSRLFPAPVFYFILSTLIALFSFFLLLIIPFKILWNISKCVE